jgi:hypothetical protein
MFVTAARLQPVNSRIGGASGAHNHDRKQVAASALRHPHYRVLLELLEIA